MSQRLIVYGKFNLLKEDEAKASVKKRLVIHCRLEIKWSSHSKVEARVESPVEDRTRICCKR